MPYLSGGNRRSGGQFGLGQSAGSGAPPPAIPERVFDGVPGFLAWLSLLLTVAGAVSNPVLTLTLGSLLAAYLALRNVLATIAAIRGLRLMKDSDHLDWHAEYERRRQPDSLAWDDVYHVVVVPNYREELIVLRQTLDRLAQQSVAKDHLIVVLAMEAAESEAAEKAMILQTEYAGKFFRIYATIHPRGISGELQVKSANQTWAIRSIKRQMLEELGLSLDQVVVTTSDADSLLHPKYLEALTCYFATSTKRHLMFWQAPILYHNNVWAIHPAMALIHAYSSASTLAYLAAPWWRALPYSTYSLSMRLLDEIGYWDTDVIADESHMFIKAYFRRVGQVELEPIFLPFSGYAVTGRNFMEASRNRYDQTKRHAWGGKEVGYTLAQMIEHPEMPFGKALELLLLVAHDNIMAGAGWVIITFGAQLPLLLYPNIVANGLQYPQYVLLQLSFLTVGISGILFWIMDFRIRPKRPNRWTISEMLQTLISLPLLAVLTVALVAIPTLEAHTRLMLGIPIRFKVSRKV